MKIGDNLKEDIEFLKGHTLQPEWWKAAKIFLLLACLLSIYFTLGIVKAIIWIAIVIVSATMVHFTYRIKTRFYTRSWMDFKTKEIDGIRTYGRIGFLYYSLVLLIFAAATAAILIL
jgi:hypothetical protein